MKLLYLDCFSGISGDMTLGALVDAGADRNYIEEELRRIQIEPFTLEWKRVNKRGISALKMDVLLDPHTPPKYHRHYSDIVRMIESAGFNERVVKLSLAIFGKIGVAEAKIHNIPIEKVHFHEVGAIDSIVDVIGTALAIDSLGIEKILSSAVPLGSGTVNCDHGIYPVPAPATLEMMKGLPILPTSYALEMTTPTGAGIVAGLVDEFAKSLPPMIVETIGYGAGTRDLPNQPNVLRVVVGQSDPYLNKYHVHHEEIRHEHDHHHHHHDPDHHHHGHTHIGDHMHEPTHGHSHDGHDHTHHTHNPSHSHGHSHPHSPAPAEHPHQCHSHDPKPEAHRH
ncbi:MULTISPECIES: LarC family nickel insertion protein [Paenibacillus]|uniref:LarC family nickel insertion protein n=1 Tax=Paenibacillus TaxID=44249 RepID=UPI0022B8AECA|nr:LarC family nickel insertion protein [Paenibacillus caseinilyticus]MCZ8522787.1 LarC family nickel insertion protein [Paenibacillus caseinilyticus]